MGKIRFKNSRWVSVMALVIGSIALFVSYYLRNNEDWWLPLFFLLFGIFAFIAFFETIFSYILLETSSLQIKENFKLKEINKDNIEKVTWEKGCGVSIQLKNGTWIKIPSIGTNAQGLTNSIRAWIKSR